MNENEIDIEIANESVAGIKEKICQAFGEVPGFQPEAVFYKAELATIRQILIANGATSSVGYSNIFGVQLRDELEELVDMGIGDAALLEEEEEFESEVGN